jgi:hypothetical protein
VPHRKAATTGPSNALTRRPNYERLCLQNVIRRPQRREFRKELPGLLTAIAALSAIARLIVVHRAILAGLLTARLVCRETNCANRGRQNRKQDFEIILHNLSVGHDEDESQ